MTDLEIIKGKLEELLEMTDNALSATEPKPKRVCNCVFGKCGRTYAVCPIKEPAGLKESQSCPESQPAKSIPKPNNALGG